MSGKKSGKVEAVEAGRRPTTGDQRAPESLGKTLNEDDDRWLAHDF
jgi:hypothetical protein